MPEPARRPGFSQPLHLHISLLLTLLLLGSGSLIGLFNYQQNAQIIRDSSRQLFDAFQAQLTDDLRNSYQPVQRLLNLLAQAPDDSQDSAQRLQQLPMLAQALRDQPALAALYISYDDGSFFQLRPLTDSALRQRFQAPSGSTLMVWSIERPAQRPARSQRLFYDARLQLLEQRTLDAETYDPRQRPWFSNARNASSLTISEPYLFFSTGEAGTTLALAHGRRVLAADLSLATLSAALARHQRSPGSELALYRPDGKVIAYPDSQRLALRDDTELPELASLSPALAALAQQDAQGGPQQGHIELLGEHWQLARGQLAEGQDDGLQLLMLTPERELLADAYRIRWSSLLLSLLILLLCLPPGWLLANRLARPLRVLVGEAEAIRRFDFQHPHSTHSRVSEIDQLAEAMARMRDSLASFLEISASLSAETRFEPLLERVLRETVGISEADAGLILLQDDDSGLLQPQALVIDGQLHATAALGPSPLASGQPLPGWLCHAAGAGSSCSAELSAASDPLLQRLWPLLGNQPLYSLSCNLHNRQGESLGLLVLLQRRQDGQPHPAIRQPQRIAHIEAIAGVAALCIDSQRLLLQQKKLLNAFIELLAGAIDAKSPYTGGHCQRVPELTLQLARAAADSPLPAFAGFKPDADQWETLQIAAWLHDCGKVTTPEYVVDKATKLETLHDRLHEVRMRFELLKLQAHCDYWQGRAGGAAEPALAALRDAELAVLDDDFAFVAQCNIGSERMDEADQARLLRIAERRWTRTLDDRIGLSWEEQQRKASQPAAPLPCQEPLLADRPEHLIERPASQQIDTDNPWGFQLKVPQHQYNRGELYNLSVRSGTLTAEEHYVINHHIVQTILMLERLPFPKALAGVSEIAGGHHEKINGEGYPKRLAGDALGLPARMLAIADVFEALTASDRPYKRGKTLGEALQLMAGMCRNGHLDPALFELFIRSGIAEDYARSHLQPEQQNRPDLSALLAGL